MNTIIYLPIIIMKPTQSNGIYVSTTLETFYFTAPLSSIGKQLVCQTRNHNYLAPSADTVFLETKAALEGDSVLH